MASMSPIAKIPKTGDTEAKSVLMAVDASFFGLSPLIFLFKRFKIPVARNLCILEHSYSSS